MANRVIGIVQKFFCEKCSDSRMAYVSESSPPPECCGEAMSVVIEGRATKSAIFPYVTTHLDGMGTPIVVESLHHLRSLERKFGVVVSGFSQNDHNPDSIRDLPTHRIGGREYEG